MKIWVHVYAHGRELFVYARGYSHSHSRKMLREMNRSQKLMYQQLSNSLRPI